MTIINLTPHALNLISGDATSTIAPSGVVARVSTTTVDAGSVDINGVVIPLKITQYGDITGLPDPTPNTIYIVSSLVAARVPDRADVWVPAEFIRDDDGRIVGAAALSHV